MPPHHPPHSQLREEHQSSYLINREVTVWGGEGYVQGHGASDGQVETEGGLFFILAVPVKMETGAKGGLACNDRSVIWGGVSVRRVDEGTTVAVAAFFCCGEMPGKIGLKEGRF